MVSLTSWLDYIESIHPQTIDMGLERVRSVAARLGVGAKPQGSFLYLVAGTNGKGSCCALLESACRAQGLSCGLYTSPHLLRFNERLRFNGAEVDDARLIAAFSRLEQARGAVSLTYFEFTTLAILLLLHEAAPEVVILEVGLGGRLDAVNIWDCDCALLSSVGLDHQQYLGDSLDAIFAEKIAVYRRSQPVVCGCRELPAASTKRLRGLDAPVLQLGVEFSYQGLSLSAADGSLLELAGLRLRADNAATAWQALQLLPTSIRPGAEVVAPAWQRLQLPGRQQCLSLKGREFILDVSHNPQAGAALADFLRARGERYVVVLAMLADKDASGYVRPLLRCVDKWHCCALPGVNRAADPRELVACLWSQGAGEGSVALHPNLPSALQSCLSLPADYVVVICGSFFTVAQGLEFLRVERV